MEDKIPSYVQKRRNMAESDAKRDAGLVPPENIERRLDIQYGPYDDNLLDVYYLKGTDKPRPVIISIHGGGYIYGDKELYSHYCMRLAQRGFSVVNFTYRLAPEYKYPAPLEDTCAVFHWIMEHGSEYFLDTKNIFMVGDSGGAQLTHQILTIATNPKYAELFSFKIPENFRVNACALNCGAYTIIAPRFFKPVGVYENYLPDNYRQMLPQFKVLKNTTSAFPPSFVMSSYYDVLRMFAKPMHRKLQRLGVESELHIYGKKGDKHMGHVFHVNCYLPEAAACNDDECNFFRRYIVE